LIVRGDLDVTARVNRGVNDWLDVGLALDDLDQQVTGSQPELIDRIGLAFGLRSLICAVSWQTSYAKQ